jgi:hypothetical protein
LNIDSNELLVLVSRLILNITNQNVYAGKGRQVLIGLHLQGTHIFFISFSQFFNKEYDIQDLLSTRLTASDCLFDASSW